MTVFDMPFGAKITEDGAFFHLYAPDASAVELVIEGHTPLLMDNNKGWKSANVKDAKAGDLYSFRIPDGPTFPDPASRYQPNGVAGPSEIVDPNAYHWRNEFWRGRPWNEAVIYEVHIGSATEEGTYRAFADRLEDLAELGITVLQIMPLAQWRGARNWGYDGVLPFAPAKSYGRPEDLKALIDKAHDLDLMVFVDVVYNHFGPSGNYLNHYATSFFTQRHKTPWGAAINFDDVGYEVTRSFFVSNALYWVNEYRVDGLRLDAVHAIHDHSERHILAEIAQSVRDACPARHVHLVLENDENQARWLTREEDTTTPCFYTAQWNDDSHHCWHAILSGEVEGYYVDFATNSTSRLARVLGEGFAYQGEPSVFRKGEVRGEPSSHLHPTAFIDFLQNHDQIGNRAFGERIDTLVPSGQLATARAVLLLSPHIPMLFMGEEWGSQKPFLYFVDFVDEPDLAEAVFAGRQREFSGFPDFAEDGLRIPDPNALQTFLQTRVDLMERCEPENQEAYLFSKKLLQLRNRYVAPLLSSRYLGAIQNHQSADGLIDLVWRFDAGALRIAINIGANVLSTDLPHGKVFYATETVSQKAGLVRLPPWAMIAVRI